jgi:signal transduction histidine kinase
MRERLTATTSHMQPLQQIQRGALLSGRRESRGTEAPMLGIDRRYALPAALALLALAALFIVTEVRKSEVRDAAMQTLSSTERLRQLTDVRSLLTDAETGGLGYVWRGERAYLSRFRDARARLPGELDGLQKIYLTADDETRMRVQRLADLARAELASMDESVSRYEQLGSAAALGGAEGGPNTELNELFDRVRGEERAAISDASRLWERRHRASTVIMAVGTILNMLLVLWAARLATRDARYRRRLAQDLEDEVSTRTRELTELSNHLQQVSEAEKRALARELHDDLGALLVAVKMDLSQLRRHLPTGDPEIDKRWARIQSALSEGIDLKRRVIEQLRPTLLDNMGLCAALKWQLQESCGRAGLACRERFPAEEPAISSDAAIALFRVVQESLTNVVKHARARTVDLSLEVVDASLVVTVQDDGVGLPDERQHLAGFHGLNSMRHRVQSLGGDLRIGLGDGRRGTRVQIAVPLATLAPVAVERA